MNLIGPAVNAFTYPRRKLWQTFGAPEENQGSALLSHLGMDPNEPATQGLGSVLEMLGDPMSYVLGPLLMKLGVGNVVPPAAIPLIDDLAVAGANVHGGQEPLEPDHPLANFLPPPTSPMQPAAGYRHRMHHGGTYGRLVL